jgi:predicted nucleic acid-binding Zn ribbon protein
MSRDATTTTTTTKCICQQPLPPGKTTFCSKECQRTERLRRARASAAAAGVDPLRVDVLGRTPRAGRGDRNS